MQDSTQVSASDLFPKSEIQSSPSPGLALQSYKHRHEFPKLRSHRKFAYLTQGGHLKPSSIPRLNNIATEQGHHAEPDFDIFFLSFSGKGSGDLFFPKSTFQQGRNALLRIALAHEVSPGYEYFIFTDEDVQLQNVENPSHFWKQNMSSNPWVRVEVI